MHHGDRGVVSELVERYRERLLSKGSIDVTVCLAISERVLISGPLGSKLGVDRRASNSLNATGHPTALFSCLPLMAVGPRITSASSTGVHAARLREELQFCLRCLQAGQESR